MNDSLGCLVVTFALGCVIGGAGMCCEGDWLLGLALAAVGVLIFALLYYVDEVNKLKSKLNAIPATNKKKTEVVTTSHATETVTTSKIGTYIKFEERLPVTKRLNRPKKKDHQLIKQLLEEQQIEYLYHFTSRRNLTGINEYGGLISWATCEKQGIQIPVAGGNDMSRYLDIHYGLQDYVRLSFCDDHPMMYKLLKEGHDMVLLKIKVDVAFWEDTLFSDMNATDRDHSCGGQLQDIMKLNFNAIKNNLIDKDDKDFKFHQAEILVKTCIPKEFIVNIDYYPYRRMPGWKIIEERFFTDEEKDAVVSAEVVDSQYGPTVCFLMKTGQRAYIPVSNTSDLKIGDAVDVNTRKIVIFFREGDGNITRVE